MPSHSPLTAPWTIGDFVIEHGRESKFGYASSFVFEGEEDLLSTLTMLRDEFGPMGDQWTASKCAPMSFQDASYPPASVPEPFHCVNIWTCDRASVDRHEKFSIELYDHMLSRRLTKANQRFAMSARFATMSFVPSAMAGAYGPPYSWVSLSGFYIVGVPDFFETNEEAVWVAVNHGDGVIEFFANDDAVLVMAKMLS